MRMSGLSRLPRKHSASIVIVLIPPTPAPRQLLVEIILMCRISDMPDEDAILNSPVVYSEQEVLAEFQAACEAERQKCPGATLRH